MCVCVCVCVQRANEIERVREIRKDSHTLWGNEISKKKKKKELSKDELPECLTSENQKSFLLIFVKKICDKRRMKKKRVKAIL